MAERRDWHLFLFPFPFFPFFPFFQIAAAAIISCTVS